MAPARPVLRISGSDHASLDPDRWPATLPAVAQLLRDGLEVPAGVTFLVGENGSGKSTIVEAVAQAYGLNVEGGPRNALHRTRETESPLGRALWVDRTPGPLVASYFLRAETMHGLYTYLEDNPSRDVRAEPQFHRMSHGESFLEVVRTRFRGYGFFLLDEPESALSFRSQLALVAALDDLRREGAQVLCATHSPVLASLPGATLLEVGDHGLRQTTYEELGVVRDWRDFLAGPGRYLRPLLE